MEDTDMVDQNLSVGSDTNLVDASMPHQEATGQLENQNPIQNGRLPALAPSPSAAVDITSPSIHEFSPAGGKISSGGKGVRDDNVTKSEHVSTANVLEMRTVGDGSTQNYSEMTTPVMPKKYSLPKRSSKSLTKSRSVWTDVETGDAGTPEEQAAFMKELETFHREKALDYKPPKFYGEPLNCLKLWRAVIKLGGYDVVTTNKYWRQVGESFNPPKTCTTVSWTFRVFYEKALLEYEKHKREMGELKLPETPTHQSTSFENESSGYQASGTGRARRDAATRAMHGWHSQRNVGYDEISEPIIKDKNLNSAPRREKPLKSIGTQKPRGFSANFETYKEMDPQIFDVGTPADWVKISVCEAKDCYEIYALVPGLLREEVRVQSDPAGRIVITGEPEQVNNPWGITPFKKVVSLPSRIDPLKTSAEVSLYGRLYVRVPFNHRAV